MIHITDRISLDENELSERFIRSSGPGGQNVNKVSTAVQLRFDVENSPSLPPDVKARLRTIASHLISDSGELLITANRERTQERNRADAQNRLIELIQRAAQPPVPRFATRPTRASKQRRLDEKAQRSVVKTLRRRAGNDE